MEIFGSVFWFLVAVGILVSFHEFGHFIVARWMGVNSEAIYDTRPLAPWRDGRFALTQNRHTRAAYAI